MQACRSSSIRLILPPTIEGFGVSSKPVVRRLAAVRNGAGRVPSTTHPGRGSVPKEIDFSSYECDCGHQSHFFENTIREAKAISHKRTVHLGVSEADEHTIVFKHGKMVEILCPRADSQRQFRRKTKRTP
jgi:hypothetical protein